MARLFGTKYYCLLIPSSPAITVSLGHLVEHLTCFSCSRPYEFQLQQFNHSLAEEGLQSRFYSEMGKVVNISKWKKINARLLGIGRGMVPPSAWTVLSILRGRGFEAYLVGGCVRDLILKRAPKDFDIITTAKLQQIKAQFFRSMIIGRRFPICRVFIKDSVVEVSSFETASRVDGNEKVGFLERPSGCDERDFILWRDSMHRDFTINSLFFDPFMHQIYDYTNGMSDLRSLKLRTITPAQLSFEEDCARILRGLRLAGRLGLSISKETETAMHKLSSSVENLGKGRIMTELNYMLSYGAAVSTICLLQKFNLLEMFLPFQATYLQKSGKRSAWTSRMLLKLFFNLDKLVSCDRPCDCLLWVGLLAFHQALAINPQDALVIWAFASVLYHGKWQDGVKFARNNAKTDVKFLPEISGFSEIKSDTELAEKVTHLAFLVQEFMNSCTSDDGNPDSPFSSVVFNGKAAHRAAKLFDVLVNDVESYNNRRENFTIDHVLLGKGDLHETRLVIGKVILETLSGDIVEGVEVTQNQPTIIQEECDSTLSNLQHDEVVIKRDKKHILLQRMDRKQKLAKTENSSEHDIVVKNVKLVKNGIFQGTTKMHKKLAEVTQLPDDEFDVIQSRRLDEDKKCLLSEMSAQRYDDSEYQDEVLKHMEASQKHNLSKEEGIKLGVRKHLHTILEAVAKKNTQHTKQDLVKKKKRDRPLLSSLFK
ncbi:hypothetical protein K2173_005000 [Erythroxylum novogranatense]|uniref:Polynucleotide adenylyltransferase n=1 Tax=Erythroxylum novogranatense TaxID=1862640 RepID=A0AAV8TB89_9ROSI|nr:hypothetical protein K2173_005000 [Erythroxylum novogranatense]